MSAIAGAGTWQTALDLDLTAQSSQTLATDGGYTIGGLTWTKGNSANEASHAANGTGLVWAPASTSDYNGTTRTLPYLWTPLSGIIATLDYATSVRAWLYVSAQNYTANYDGSVLAIDDNAAGSPTGGIMKPAFVSSLGVGGMYQVKGAVSNNPASYVQAMALSTYNVYCLELPGGVAKEQCHMYAGSWSSGWPAFSSMRLVGRSYFGIGLPTFEAASSFGLLLGAQRAGSTTTLSVTHARVRVDYRN